MVKKLNILIGEPDRTYLKRLIYYFDKKNADVLDINGVSDLNTLISIKTFMPSYDIFLVNTQIGTPKKGFIQMIDKYLKNYPEGHVIGYTAANATKREYEKFDNYFESTSNPLTDVNLVFEKYSSKLKN